MAKLNITQAAKRVGVSRQTFYRHIEKKGISTSQDADGNPVVDTAELLRVYGELQGDDGKRNAPPRQRATLSNDNPDRALQAEVDRLTHENGSLKELARVAAERVERAEKEADRWHTQAERLSLALAHFKPEPVAAPEPADTAPERIKTPGELVEVETGKLDPAPAVETSIAGAGKPAGAFAWLFGIFRPRSA